MLTLNTVYHVYNQTNNSEKLFKSDDNYLYFIKKMRKELLPVCDILCYCLMPTHFHILLVPNDYGCSDSTVQRPASSGEAEGVYFQQQFSQKIKVLLSSYTRGFNAQHGRRGSLFRPKTKVVPVHKMYEQNSFSLPDTATPQNLKAYLKTCFHYIHDNPVKANIVDHSTSWPYSSALDYFGQRGGTLCNYFSTEKLIGIRRSNSKA
ncbi:hypothetical protein A3850_007035 [Lewinella sp. 4G2]|nr:hypothetical protein A3850_007035 [Lewinella sp. 4G2]